MDLRALAGRDTIPFRQFHLFLRAAVGGDAGLFLAHRHRDRNLDVGLWIIAIIWVWFQPDRNPELTAQIATAIGSDHRLLDLISPNSIVFGARMQEIAVIMIAAVTLAIAVRRGNDLLIHHAASSASAPIWRATSRRAWSRSCRSTTSR